MAQFLKARMAYRVDFFMSIATSVLTTALSFVFILVIFDKVSALDGWSFYEVLFIYGFALIPTALFSLISSNFWFFGDKYIIEGAFDRILLRPLHSLYQIFFESFRIEALPDILVGVYLVWYAAHGAGTPLSPFDWPILIGLALCGTFLLIAVFTIVTSLNFWMEDRIGIGAPLYNMIALGRYPITLYNNVLKLILSSAIPFAYVAFYPSTWFLERKQFATYVYLTPLVTLGFCAFALFVWSQGVKRYGSTGN